MRLDAPHSAVQPPALQPPAVRRWNRGEVAQQASDIRGLAAHEHALVGDEDLVEVHHGLVVGVHLAEVDALDVAADLEEALVLRGAAEDEGHARGVRRDGAGDGEVLLIRLHVRRRDYDDLMREQYAGLVALEALMTMPSSRISSTWT